MLEKPGETLTITQKNMSLWHIYNCFTERVTHGNKSFSGVLTGSKAVNTVFKGLAEKV
jgi:hypothetical protein